MVRRAQRTRAVFLIITVAIGGLLLAMAADLAFAPLPSAARWSLFVMWIAVLLVSSRRALAPLFRDLPLIRIARWLEDRHPEMQERLSTVLELSGSRNGGSSDLLDEIAMAAGRDIGTINPGEEVRSARKRRQWKAPALLAVGLMVLVLAAWPQAAFRLLLRAIAPFSDVGNAGALEFGIMPGDTELLEGDALNITFTVSRVGQTPQLRLQTPSAGETIQPVTAVNSRFGFTIDPVKETVRYQVLAGRSQSDTFTATVLPMPALTKPGLVLEYPAYTALPIARIDPAKGVKAVAGTKVTLTASVNTALESSWIELDGKRIAEGQFKASSQGGNLNFDWVLDADSSGEALVVLSHRLRQRIETLRFRMEVTGDKPPEVAILSPARRELRVRPEETVPIRHEIIEDYGVAEVSLDTEAAGVKSSLVQRLPERFGSATPPHYRGEAQLAVGTLRDLDPKLREFRVRITARDARPAELGGAGIGHSEWITVRIDEHTESLARQELRSQREEARKSIEEAIRDIREAKQQANRAEDGMRKESPPKEAAEQLEKAAARLAEAEEKTSAIAEDLTESLHAAKSEDLEETSEELAEAREKIENAPLQENGEQRGDQLREADQQLEQAISKLEKVRNAIERDQQRAEDVVALQELADKQNELARQAEAKVAPDATADMPPDEQWSEKQKQVAQALKQEVSERADAKAEALKAQAEKARDLAEKASQLAKAQEQLGAESQQLAENNSEQPAAGDLAENQQDQAEAASELAEDIESLSALEPNSPARQAAQAAEQGAKAAEAASNKISEAAGVKPDEPGESKPTPGEAANAKQSGEASAPSPAETADAQADSNKSAESSPGESNPSPGEPANGKQPGEAAAPSPAETADAQAASNKAAESSPGESNPSPGEPANGKQPGEPAAPSPAEMAAAKAAAPLNERAGEMLAESAAALEQAAEQFEQAAQAAAAQAQSATPPQGQAQAPAAPMAAALEAAAEAATTGEATEAAEQSAAAAQALAQAAAAAQQAMKSGQPSQGPPAAMPPGAVPGMAQEPSMAQPTAEYRKPGVDPGVPPELGKLGISAADWERIKATLGSDVSAAESEGIPVEYRSLVRDYFQNLSKTPADKR